MSDVLRLQNQYNRVNKKHRGRKITFLGNLVWLIFGRLLRPGLHCRRAGHVSHDCWDPVSSAKHQVGHRDLCAVRQGNRRGHRRRQSGRVVFNILWLVLFGWAIAVAHLTAAVLLAITIIGIPFALQHIKLIPLALFPFGRDLR